MVPGLRQTFNAQWTEARYRALKAALEDRLHGPIEFPVAETPCFFPRVMLDELVTHAEALVAQAMAPDVLAVTRVMTPTRFRGPGEEAHPTFLQVDFGLVRREDGGLEPRLVELQAFASLYGFQLLLAEQYRASFDLPPTARPFLGDWTRETYLAELQRAIVGDHSPSEVVLLEIDPERQKTRPDFVATEQLWGVHTVDVRAVEREGRTLFHRRDGRRQRIARIYNRVIPDEVERLGLTLPFDYRDDLDVEWAGHPAWYFYVSKASIPHLHHGTVPRTWSLAEVDPALLPLPPEALLLKPLFSFAGGGIVFAPTREALQAIPPKERAGYLLQERIAFTPVIDTPDGATQAELRVMFVWNDTPRAALALVRMGRGKMMGVDHNKGLRWVGASAAFAVEGRGDS